MYKLINLSVIATALLSINIYAANVTVESASPSLYFDDTDHITGNPSYQWKFGTNTNADATINDFYMYELVNQQYVMRFYGTDSGKKLTNTLIVNSSGDINLADGSVFIDKSANHVGIGTTIPQGNSSSTSLDITSTSTSELFFSDAFNGWEIYTGASGLWFKDQVTASNPFKVINGAPTNSLVVYSSGNIGIGTSGPSAKLDVVGDIKSTVSVANTAGDGLTSLMVLEATNTDVSKVSDTAFVLRNGRTGKQWNFRTTKDGTGFAATINGTGGTEFEVVNDTNDFQNTKLYIGGKLVFANGKIQAGVLP